MGLIIRTCRDFDDRKALTTLYCALVRSSLEYYSLVWSPYTKKNVEKLGKVQRRATKFILKTEDYYDSRSKKLILLSLKKRRLLTDITFLCKALHGLNVIDIDIERYVNFMPLFT